MLVWGGPGVPLPTGGPWVGKGPPDTSHLGQILHEDTLLAGSAVSPRAGGGVWGGGSKGCSAWPARQSQRL